MTVKYRVQITEATPHPRLGDSLTMTFVYSATRLEVDGKAIAAGAPELGRIKGTINGTLVRPSAVPREELVPQVLLDAAKQRITADLQRTGAVPPELQPFLLDGRSQDELPANLEHREKPPGKAALMLFLPSQEYWPSAPRTQLGANCQSAPACTPPIKRAL